MWRFLKHLHVEEQATVVLVVARRAAHLDYVNALRTRPVPVHGTPAQHAATYTDAVSADPAMTQAALVVLVVVVPGSAVPVLRTTFVLADYAQRLIETLTSEGWAGWRAAIADPDDLPPFLRAALGVLEPEEAMRAFPNLGASPWALGRAHTGVHPAFHGLCNRISLLAAQYGAHVRADAPAPLLDADHVAILLLVAAGDYLLRGEQLVEQMVTTMSGILALDVRVCMYYNHALRIIDAAARGEPTPIARLGSEAPELRDALLAALDWLTRAPSALEHPRPERVTLGVDTAIVVRRIDFSTAADEASLVPLVMGMLADPRAPTIRDTLLGGADAAEFARRYEFLEVTDAAMPPAKAPPCRLADLVRNDALATATRESGLLLRERHLFVAPRGLLAKSAPVFTQCVAALMPEALPALRGHSLLVFPLLASAFALHPAGFAEVGGVMAWLLGGDVGAARAVRDAGVGAPADALEFWMPVAMQRLWVAVESSMALPDRDLMRALALMVAPGVRLAAGPHDGYVDAAVAEGLGADGTAAVARMRAGAGDAGDGAAVVFTLANYMLEISDPLHCTAETFVAVVRALQSPHVAPADAEAGRVLEAGLRARDAVVMPSILRNSRGFRAAPAAAGGRGAGGGAALPNEYPTELPRKALEPKREPDDYVAAMKLVAYLEIGVRDVQDCLIDEHEADLRWLMGGAARRLIHPVFRIYNSGHFLQSDLADGIPPGVEPKPLPGAAPAPAKRALHTDLVFHNECVLRLHDEGACGSDISDVELEAAATYHGADVLGPPWYGVSRVLAHNMRARPPRLGTFGVLRTALAPPAEAALEAGDFGNYVIEPAQDFGAGIGV